MKNGDEAAEEAWHKAAVFLSVHTQFENAGDALIVRELINLAADIAPTFVDLSRCPSSFRSTLNLGALPNVVAFEHLGTGRLLAQMLRSRLSGHRTVYFLAPGGRGGELTVRGYVKAHVTNALLGLFSSLGVRVCHIGVSYDRLGPRHIAALRRRSRILAHHAVRDEVTRDHLSTNGIRVDAVIPDLALNRFQHEHVTSGAGSNALALSFRRDKYPERETEILEAVGRILETLEPDTTVRIVSQVARDDSFMSRLYDHITSHFDINGALHLCSSSIDDCRSAYSGCEQIYSNRLHALLLAASVGATPIGIIDRERDAKIVGVFEGLGRDDLLVPIEQVTGVIRPRPLDRVALAATADGLRASLTKVIRPRA